MARQFSSSFTQSLLQGAAVRKSTNKKSLMDDDDDFDNSAEWSKAPNLVVSSSVDASLLLWSNNDNNNKSNNTSPKATSPRNNNNNNNNTPRQSPTSPMPPRTKKLSSRAESLDTGSLRLTKDGSSDDSPRRTVRFGVVRVRDHYRQGKSKKSPDVRKKTISRKDLLEAQKTKQQQQHSNNKQQQQKTTKKKKKNSLIDDDDDDELPFMSHSSMELAWGPCKSQTYELEEYEKNHKSTETPKATPRKSPKPRRPWGDNSRSSSHDNHNNNNNNILAQLGVPLRDASPKRRSLSPRRRSISPRRRNAAVATSRSISPVRSAPKQPLRQISVDLQDKTTTTDKWRMTEPKAAPKIPLRQVSVDDNDKKIATIVSPRRFGAPQQPLRQVSVDKAPVVHTPNNNNNQTTTTSSESGRQLGKWFPSVQSLQEGSPEDGFAVALSSNETRISATAPKLPLRQLSVDQVSVSD